MRLFFLLYLHIAVALESNDYRLGSPDGAMITALPPAPTRGPGAAELRRAIDRRQAGPVTCGWVSGRANQPFTCGAGSACVFNTKYDVFGCCAGDVSTCSLQTACFGSAYASIYTANGYTRGCTDSVNNKCVTYEMGLLYTSYGCGPTQTYFYLSSTVLGDSITAVGITTGFFPAIFTTSSNIIVGANGAAVTTLPPASSVSADGGIAVNGAQPTSGSGGGSSSSSSQATISTTVRMQASMVAQASPLVPLSVSLSQAVRSFYHSSSQHYSFVGVVGDNPLSFQAQVMVVRITDQPSTHLHLRAILALQRLEWVLCHQSNHR